MLMNDRGHDILGPFDFVELADGELRCGRSDVLGRNRAPLVFKITPLYITYKGIVYDRWSVFSEGG